MRNLTAEVNVDLPPLAPSPGTHEDSQSRGLSSGSRKPALLPVPEPDLNQELKGMQGGLPRRENIHIPRIVIGAHCESSDVAEALERAAQDRLMSRAHVTIHRDGILAACAHYQQISTPNLLIVESRSPSGIFLAELDRLAEVCDPSTKVLAIGRTNDIGFYRELTKRGVNEYVLAPADPTTLIAAISAVYSEPTAGKLGKVCAFIGAKGGVGSSTVAHNVGSAMARRLGSDVIIADLDLPFGTAGLDFNLEIGPGIAEALQDASRLDEVLLDRLLTKCADHLSLLGAPAILEKTYDLDPRSVAALLEVAQASAPFVILDMPHLWASWAKDALISVDEIIITAAPDLANLRNAKNIISFLKEARPHDPPPKLILNQVGMPKRPEIKPREFANALQIGEAIACIPFDAHLFGTAANNGKMLSEISAKAAAPKAFAEVAEVIANRKEQKGRENSVLKLGFLLNKLKGSKKESGKKNS